MRTRTRCACGLCGSRELDLDEVLDAGVLCLAACVRCGHRWTERPLVALARAAEAEGSAAA